MPEPICRETTRARPLKRVSFGWMVDRVLERDGDRAGKAGKSGMVPSWVLTRISGSVLASGVKACVAALIVVAVW